MAKAIKNKQYNEFWEDDKLDIKKSEKDNESKVSSEEIKKLEKKLSKKVSGLEKEIKEIKGDKEVEEIKPINPPRGWHARNEFIDEIGNKFEKGVYLGNIKDEAKDEVKEEPKKEIRKEEPKKEIKKIEQPKPVINKTIDKPKPLTTKDIYQQYITDNISFKMYFRGNLIFDSKVQPLKNYPIFKDDGFILFGKNYIYRGIRIEKY